MTTVSGKDAERFLKEKKRIENLDPNSKEGKKRKKYFKECERVYSLVKEHKPTEVELASTIRLMAIIREKDNEIALLKRKWLRYASKCGSLTKRVGELKAEKEQIIKNQIYLDRDAFAKEDKKDKEIAELKTERDFYKSVYKGMSKRGV